MDRIKFKRRSIYNAHSLIPGGKFLAVAYWYLYVNDIKTDWSVCYDRYSNSDDYERRYSICQEQSNGVTITHTRRATLLAAKHTLLDKVYMEKAMTANGQNIL